MGDKVASSIVASATVTTESSPAVPAVSTKKARSKPTHPRTSEMVNAAIKSLKERSGSSIQAIKKYVASTYKVDAEKHAPFIKRYLKTAVASGVLVQTKGKGASGSFKLALAKADTTKSKVQRSSAKTVGSKKKVAVKKPAADKKAAIAKKSDVGKKATATTKKPVAVKKSTAAVPATNSSKKIVAAVKESQTKSKATKAAVAKAPKATKSPSKVKKVAKAPTTKPKAPKPKKAAPASKSAKPSSKKPIAQKK